MDSNFDGLAIQGVPCLSTASSPDILPVRKILKQWGLLTGVCLTRCYSNLYEKKL